MYLYLYMCKYTHVHVTYFHFYVPQTCIKNLLSIDMSLQYVLPLNQRCWYVYLLVLGVILVAKSMVERAAPMHGEDAFSVRALCVYAFVHVSVDVYTFMLYINRWLN